MPAVLPRIRVSAYFRWGGRVEVAGYEEHAELVVVVVGEAAGDAAGEFDQSVHGLGAAVG